MKVKCPVQEHNAFRSTHSGSPGQGSNPGYLSGARRTGRFRLPRLPFCCIKQTLPTKSHLNLTHDFPNCALFCFTVISRRAITANQVYIADGFPKQSSFSPSDLRVAVFVSTGDNKFLSRSTLLNVIIEYQGNLSRALDRRITGVARLNLDVYTFGPTESPGTSGKTKLLYIFFGAFFGVVFLLGVCICVTCW